MSFLSNRKILAAALSATVLASTFAVSTKADAHPFGFGWGGFGAGVALGAIASSAAQPAYGYGYGDCYISHRRFIDSWGNEYVRRVRVCD